MPDRKKYFIPTDELERYIAEKTLTHTDVAKLLRGVGSGAVSSWLRTKKMPGWVPVALEGIRRRQRVDTTTAIVSGDPAKMITVRQVVQAMGVKYTEIDV